MAEEIGYKEILSANADFKKRIENLTVRVSYDEEFDIFLVAFGNPQEAITEEIRDGLRVRIDPQTLKILGFEIMGFRRHYLKANPEFAPHVEALFEKSPMKTREIPPRSHQHKQAERALRDLAPALP